MDTLHQNYFHNRKVIVLDIGVWLIIDNNIFKR